MSRFTARLVLDQVNNRPIFVAPSYAGVAACELTMGVVSAIQDLARADVDVERAAWEVRKRDLVLAYGGTPGAQPEKPFAFAGGKAIVPVHGMLLNRFPYSWGFATGYNFIQSQVAAAMDDPEVDGIIYDVNSFGGLVTGCQETSDFMFGASARQGGKPSLAVVDANCYSAAYYLASAADQITLTPSGGAGSIGVLLMHVDVSKALSDMGVKVTFIHAGSHKVDANAYEPLSDEVTADLQNEIDKMYGTFCATVARNRAGMSEQAVRDTEARIYQADTALALGLVDAVQTPSDALRMFFDAEGNTNEDTNMPVNPTQQTKNDGTGAGAAAPDQQQVAAAAAAQEARNSERERIRAIHGLSEAEGRTELASHLAHDTDLSPEAAQRILAAAPKAAAAAPPPAKQETKADETNYFKAAMDNGKHPNVGADSSANGGGDGDGGKPSRAQQILQAQQKATGFKKQEAKGEPQRPTLR